MTKYTYEYILQGNHGYGWDDLTAAPQTSAGLKAVREDRKSYRLNAPEYAYRIVKRRTLNA
jgi:hypothetical protein